jgi:hypothetical protein
MIECDPFILSTVERHVYVLIRTVNRPDNWIFFFENRLHWQFEVRLLLLQYVPVSKLFHHAWFEVVEAITLPVLDAITGNFKAS